MTSQQQQQQQQQQSGTNPMPNQAGNDRGSAQQSTSQPTPQGSQTGNQLRNEHDSQAANLPPHYTSSQGTQKSAPSDAQASQGTSTSAADVSRGTSSSPSGDPTNSIGSVSEKYRGGDRVIYSGEYILIDSQGNLTDYEILTLDEGESFPVPVEEHLLYQLHFEIGDPITEAELSSDGSSQQPQGSASGSANTMPNAAASNACAAPGETPFNRSSTTQEGVQGAQSAL